MLVGTGLLLLVTLLLAGAGVGVWFYLSSQRQLPPGKEEPRALPGQVEAPVAKPGVEPGEEPATEPVAEKPAVPERLEAPVPKPSAEPEGFFKRLVAGLAKTQSQLVEKLDAVLRGRKEIDAALYEELETILISGDVGVKTTTRLLDAIKARATREDLKDPSSLRSYLQESIRATLLSGKPELATVPEKPLVILVVGVNGTGKTTTIGKLAARFAREGKQVILAAGDTFRAAAIEQLEVWGERSGATVIKNKEGTDPSAVIFDALKAAKARGADVVIADTAGRLHTKVNLMEELKKVNRVIQKAIPGAPHEVLLVLDATMGQNALSQARTFHEGTQLTGLILTKLDGTAKGGVIIGILDELKLPVKFIGVGEKVDDLQPFDPEQFVKALF